MDTLKHYVITVCAATTATALVLAYLVISQYSYTPELLWYAGFIMLGVLCIFYACIKRIFHLAQQAEIDKQTALDRELERKKEWASFELDLKNKEMSLKKEWKIFEQQLQNEDKGAELQRELETKKEVFALTINEKKITSQLTINENKAKSELIIERAEKLNESGITVGTYDPNK